MAEIVLAKVNRATLREQVLENLRDSILTGAMPPGTRLAEADLSEKLGVSRGTIREALRTLMESGLVENSKRGVRVRQLSARDVAELYRVRLALEKEALTSLLEKEDADSRIDRLEAALPPDHADISGDLAARLDDDLRFHELLCELSDNSMLLGVWRQMLNLMRVAILGDSKRTNEEMMTRANHEPLIAALRTGDPIAAQATLQQHMNAASEKFAAAASQE